MEKWIDGDGVERVGQVGFLVSRSNPYDRWEHFELRDHPAHTNRSHAPRLIGWCGSTDNVSTHAIGLFRVIKVAKNGRVKVSEIKDRKVAEEVLEDLGYPDLIEEFPEEA